MVHICRYQHVPLQGADWTPLNIKQCCAGAISLLAFGPHIGIQPNLHEAMRGYAGEKEMMITTRVVLSFGDILSEWIRIDRAKDKSCWIPNWDVENCEEKIHVPVALLDPSCPGDDPCHCNLPPRPNQVSPTFKTKRFTSDFIVVSHIHITMNSRKLELGPIHNAYRVTPVDLITLEGSPESWFFQITQVLKSKDRRRANTY